MIRHYGLLWFTMVYYGKPHHRIFCVPYMKQQVYCRNYVKRRLQRMVWHGHKSIQSIWVFLPHTIWLIFEYLPSNAKHGAHTSNDSREVRGGKGSTCDFARRQPVRLMFGIVGSAPVMNQGQYSHIKLPRKKGTVCWKVGDNVPGSFEHADVPGSHVWCPVAAPGGAPFMRPFREPPHVACPFWCVATGPWWEVAGEVTGVQPTSIKMPYLHHLPSRKHAKKNKKHQTTMELHGFLLEIVMIYVTWGIYLEGSQMTG